MPTSKEQTMVKRKNSFGNNILKTQPQPYGFTKYGGVGKNGGFRKGNALSCNLNKIESIQPQLNAYQNYGPFLGILKGSTFGKNNNIDKFQKNFGGPNPSTNIYQTKNPYIQEAPLKRPYGPRDNATMKGVHWAGSQLPPFDLNWNYSLGQFGSRKKRRSNKKQRKSNTIKRRSNKKQRRSNKKQRKSVDKKQRRSNKKQRR